jgi:hypothetical protein
MCSKKPKITYQEAAAPVAAPTDTGNMTTIDTEGQKRKRKAVGKKKLMINSNAGSGTGVNV